MTDHTQNYLHDVLIELLERAREASREAAKGNTNEFAQGRAMAYFEVVDHLVNQLESFGIDRAAVGIGRDFDAMKELR